MQPTRITKTSTCLLGAMALGMASLSTSSLNAKAFPILWAGNSGFGDYGIHQIDNRTYRHCLNGPRFTYCYTRKAGEPDAPRAGRGIRTP